MLFMIKVEKEKDKYKFCNACGRRKGKFVKVNYGKDFHLYSSFTLCEKCQEELIEKLWKNEDGLG